MFEFTEQILIEAPQPTVWNVMYDLEGWWPASNPEHQSLERLDQDAPITVGTRLRIREKIAGIPGEALGTIIDLEPGSVVTWEAPAARYRWFGVTITMGEGVTWRLQAGANGTTYVSAHVWAHFPPHFGGRLLEIVFTRLVGGIEKDREHARTELRYLKSIIEATTAQHPPTN